MNEGYGLPVRADYGQQLTFFYRQSDHGCRRWTADRCDAVDNATSSPNHNYLNNLTSVLRTVTHGRHNLPGYTTVHAVGVSNCPGIQSTLSVHILTGAVPPFSHSSPPVRASLSIGTGLQLALVPGKSIWDLRETRLHRGTLN